MTYTDPAYSEGERLRRITTEAEAATECAAAAERASFSNPERAEAYARAAQAHLAAAQAYALLRVPS